MPEMGKFSIQARLGNIVLGKMDIDLEDLLQKKDLGEKELILEQVTLNVSQTILLVNQFFL